MNKYYTTSSKSELKPTNKILKNLLLTSVIITSISFNYSFASTMQCNLPSVDTPVDDGWTINANFDVGAPDSPAIGDDAFHSDAGKSRYTTEQSVQGQAAKLSIVEGTKGFGSWGGIWKLPQRAVTGDTIHVSFWTYFPHGFDYHSYGEGGVLKVFRLKTRNSSGRHTGYNDFLINRKSQVAPFLWMYEGEQVLKQVGEPADDIQTGVWENFQISLTLDSVSKDDGGQSEVKIWKNGVLIYHDTGRRSLTAAGDGYVDAAYMFTYWNGGAPQTQSMYIDEVVITTNTPSGSDGLGNAIIPLR